jgi:choline dehydrogenase-like flavoprotein
LDAFFKALQQAGYPVTTDVNGFQQEGFGKFDRITERGCRWNAARAYVHPVRNRRNLTIKWYNQPWFGFKWLFGRTGEAATNHFEAGGFIRSNDRGAFPNVHFHFRPLAIRYQVQFGPMNPDMRERVKIKSDDPADHPIEMRSNF